MHVNPLGGVASIPVVIPSYSQSLVQWMKQVLDKEQAYFRADQHMENELLIGNIYFSLINLRRLSGGLGCILQIPC